MLFFTIASGSKGNCAFAAAGRTSLLVDAGVSCARIERALRAQGQEPGALAGVLLTHEHHDHIAGVERLAKKYGLPVYASPKTWEALAHAVSLPPSLCRSFSYDMQLGDFRLDFCKISHDAVQPVGLVLEAAGRRLAYVTDTGCVTKGMCHSLRRLDALVLEANHDWAMLMQGPYAPALKRRVAGLSGHLANTQAAELLDKLLEAEPSCRVLLAHLSETNNTPDLAYAAAAKVLEQHRREPEAQLAVAPAADISQVWQL